MNKKIIVVNGIGGSGKDTFVDFCTEYLSTEDKTVLRISSVDNVKLVAPILGWDEKKDSKGREFLHRLKMLSVEFYNGPLEYMKESINRCERDYIFVFIREVEEIEKFVEYFPEVVTVLVFRPDIEKFDNYADNEENVYSYPYDYIIVNNEDLETLNQSSINLMRLVEY